MAAEMDVVWERRLYVKGLKINSIGFEFVKRISKIGVDRAAYANRILP